MMRDLHTALEEAGQDTGVRAIVLTGAGRGFCSGLDLTDTEFDVRAGGLGTARALRAQRLLSTLTLRMRSTGHPIIAAVNGVASGAGVVLALASDVRVVARSTRFSLRFGKVGILGGDVGLSWLLPRAIGTGKAFELMLTGRPWDASEAEAMGLVSRVVVGGEAVAAAIDSETRAKAWLVSSRRCDRLHSGPEPVFIRTSLLSAAVSSPLLRLAASTTPRRDAGVVPTAQRRTRPEAVASRAPIAHGSVRFGPWADIRWRRGSR